MTSRLQLYNKALTAIGSRNIASLTENRESRRVLDSIWDAGAVENCLEQGYWNFAMRTVRIDSTSEIEPDFGYAKAFQKPDDWVRTYAFCSDEYYNHPITQYADEVGYWWCDTDPIYVQYVSNDKSYGLSYGDWPESFTRYVELYLASEACLRLTGNQGLNEKIEQKMKLALREARTQDATNEPTKFQPLGSWVGARFGRNGGRGRYNIGNTL